ncbi:hypothetical protein CPC08DRAFT_774905 [Agrocybe pediades]|nr:hypothetical protein CPC08DRAFT_774905 [Agrocybe pediades]
MFNEVQCSSSKMGNRTLPTKDAKYEHEISLSAKDTAHTSPTPASLQVAARALIVLAGLHKCCVMHADMLVHEYEGIDPRNGYIPGSFAHIPGNPSAIPVIRSNSKEIWREANRTAQLLTTQGTSRDEPADGDHSREKLMNNATAPNSAFLLSFTRSLDIICRRLLYEVPVRTYHNNNSLTESRL